MNKELQEYIKVEFEKLNSDETDDWGAPEFYEAGATLIADKLMGEMEELKKENERMKFKEIVYMGENRYLRDKLLKIQKENGLDPYWYFPQCDVEGCESVSSNGGGCWRETGYWSVCPEHAREWREGKPQPQMKQSAIDKEATRDKVTGCLPIGKPDDAVSDTTKNNQGGNDDNQNL